jgi:hypothetical protein
VRQAPPVSLSCDGGGGWRVAQALLAAAAGGSLAAWAGLHGGLALAAAGAVASAAAVLAGALGWYRARPQPAELRWDGQCWSLGGSAGQVDVMIDLGAWMLLRFRPAAAGAARWLPVPDAGPMRHGLRAALFSRASGTADANPRAPAQAND